MKANVFFVAAAMLLVGAGCAPLEKLQTTLARVPWFDAPANMSGETALAIDFQQGLSFEIRPTTLGVTGSVDEVFGDESRLLRVTVREAEPEAAVSLEWKTSTATGTLALQSFEGAHAMLLPAFWPEGSGEASQNGVVWMSRSAFASLQNDGKVEWRLGLAERALSAVSSAFQTFNALAATYAGSASSSALVSPFQLQKTGTSDAFPLLLDGRLELVRVVRATSWFADIFVLDNPENPLILKVVVHPVARPALIALEPTSVRWNEMGYEITSISRP